jgi:hypothetical protein
MGLDMLGEGGRGAAQARSLPPSFTGPDSVFQRPRQIQGGQLDGEAAAAPRSQPTASSKPMPMPRGHVGPPAWPTCLNEAVRCPRLHRRSNFGAEDDAPPEAADGSGRVSGGIFKTAAQEILAQEARLMTSGKRVHNAATPHAPPLQACQPNHLLTACMSIWMCAGEITKLAIERKLLKCTGKTPENTMASALYTEVRKKAATTVFIKCVIPHRYDFDQRQQLTAPAAGTSRNGPDCGVLAMFGFLVSRTSPTRKTKRSWESHKRSPPLAVHPWLQAQGRPLWAQVLAERAVAARVARRGEPPAPRGQACRLRCELPQLTTQQPLGLC